MNIYLIGSLRNPQVPVIGQALRDAGHEVYDDWFAAGPEADDRWQEYEKQARGRDMKNALGGWAARHTCANDLFHLNRASAGVLVTPAGRSGHLELGYLIGLGRRGYVLLHEDPDRWDVMYLLAHGVFTTVDALVAEIHLDSVDRCPAPRTGVYVKDEG